LQGCDERNPKEDFRLVGSSLQQQQNTLVDLTINPNLTTSDLRMNVSSKSDSLDDGGLTGKVGTALYVSPEMTDAQKRTHYSQVCE
jgi:hypothetical protein